MDNNNESSPPMNGSQIPTVPMGSGWGQMGGQMGPGFNVPWQQLMGMLAGAQGGMQGGNRGRMPWGMPGCRPAAARQRRGGEVCPRCSNR